MDENKPRPTSKSHGRAAVVGGMAAVLLAKASRVAARAKRAEAPAGKTKPAYRAPRDDHQRKLPAVSPVAARTMPFTECDWPARTPRPAWTYRAARREAAKQIHRRAAR